MDGNALNKNRSGLTLTEVLIVISIIAMLAVIAAIVSRAQISKGYDARRKTDFHQIKIGLEEYEKDHDCYPPAPLGCGDATAIAPYMEDVPCDPEPPYDPYFYSPESGACPGWFWIFTDLDYEQDPAIVDVGCGTGCGLTDTGPFYNYYTSSPNAPDPFIDITGYFGCMPENTCVGIPDEDWCEPNYSGLGMCESMCPGAIVFCK